MSSKKNTDNLTSIANTLAPKQKVSGVILIDKPIGMTSQQVVSKVKYLFKSPSHDSKKAGHTGTLDPMATGLLPICLGEATKFSHYQLNADKTYRATILLGSQTDTGDADGQIIHTSAVPEFDDKTLAAIVEQFMGEQQQIPPMYSALKKDGKKLYEYARAGIEVERPARHITIKALSLIILNKQELELTVTCSKGTYVRVLGEDIAKAMNTLGHLTALRRLQVGDFKIDNAITIPDLEALSSLQRHTRLLPVDACIDIDSKLTLLSEQCERIAMGQRLNVINQLTPELKDYIAKAIEQQQCDKENNVNAQNIDTIKVDETSTPSHEIPVDIRLLNENGDFIGLGAVSLNGRLQPKKLIQD